MIFPHRTLLRFPWSHNRSAGGRLYASSWTVHAGSGHHRNLVRRSSYTCNSITQRRLLTSAKCGSLPLKKAWTARLNLSRPCRGPIPHSFRPKIPWGRFRRSYWTMVLPSMTARSSANIWIRWARAVGSYRKQDPPVGGLCGSKRWPTASWTPRYRSFLNGVDRRNCSPLRPSRGPRRRSVAVWLLSLRTSALISLLLLT